MTIDPTSAIQLSTIRLGGLTVRRLVAPTDAKALGVLIQHSYEDVKAQLRES